MPTICPSCGAANLEGLDACANCGADLTKVDLPKPASQIEGSVMNLPLTALEMTPAHVVAPGDTLEAAAAALAGQKVDLLEVIEDGRLVGLLSVRDFIARCGPDYKDKLSRPVREFMTAPPETLPPDAPVTFAINRMDVGGYRHVPVVQGERVLGVVSSRDVIKWLVKHSREQVATEGLTTSHGVEE